MDQNGIWQEGLKHHVRFINHSIWPKAKEAHFHRARCGLFGLVHLRAVFPVPALYNGDHVT